ncbi:MAG: hypothetical protein WDA75_16770, partial [Candidatus Latescibacterota bacterium]
MTEQLRQRLAARRARTAEAGLGRNRGPAFPLSAAEILELRRAGLVALLDGRVVHVLRRPPRADEPWAELGGIRQAAVLEGDLQELLAKGLTQHVVAIEDWWGQRHPVPAADLFGTALPPADEARDAAIAAFVDTELLPRLRAEAKSAGTGTACQDSMSQPPDLTAARDQGEPTSARSLAVGPRVAAAAMATAPVWAARLAAAVARRWPRWGAFSGMRHNRLVPLWGRPFAGQLHLRLGKDQFMGLPPQPIGQAVLELDRVL